MSEAEGGHLDRGVHIISRDIACRRGSSMYQHKQPHIRMDKGGRGDGECKI